MVSCALAARAGAGTLKPIATCGNSKVELVTEHDDATRALHVTIAHGGSAWTFRANVAQFADGEKVWTFTLDGLKTEGRAPRNLPLALTMDVWSDDQKVVFRHPAKGKADHDYLADLDHCDVDSLIYFKLIALRPPFPDPSACGDAETPPVRKEVEQLTKLTGAPLDDATDDLCFDRVKTGAARFALERSLLAHTSQARLTARGPALLQLEESYRKAAASIQACRAPSQAHDLAGLHAVEASRRDCYAKLAPSM